MKNTAYTCAVLLLNNLFEEAHDCQSGKAGPAAGDPEGPHLGLERVRQVLEAREGLGGAGGKDLRK